MFRLTCERMDTKGRTEMPQWKTGRKAGQRAGLWTVVNGHSIPGSQTALGWVPGGQDPRFLQDRPDVLLLAFPPVPSLGSPLIPERGWSGLQLGFTFLARIPTKQA